MLALLFYDLLDTAVSTCVSVEQNCCRSGTKGRDSRRTFFLHPHRQTLLVATERAALPLGDVHWAALSLCASVVFVVLHGAFEKTLQRRHGSGLVTFGFTLPSSTLPYSSHRWAGRSDTPIFYPRTRDSPRRTRASCPRPSVAPELSKHSENTTKSKDTR